MRLSCSLLTAVVVGCAGAPQDSSAGFDPVDVPHGPAAPSRTAPLGACPWPPGKTLRTLIIGNSQIYFWDVPKLLSDLSMTAPPECPRIAAEGFTNPGVTLKWLWEEHDSGGRDLATTIESGDYDVVVMAESLDLVDFPPPKTQFVTYANLIIDAARASGAMPVLYATPYSESGEHRGFLEMAQPQIDLGLARAVRVAAGGPAWLRVWRELPTVDLHDVDHGHPGYKGDLVLAMLLYAVITGGGPVALDPEQPRDCERVPGEHAPCPAISQAEVDVFQEAALAEAAATGR
jgi:hypothetical protein